MIGRVSAHCPAHQISCSCCSRNGASRPLSDHWAWSAFPAGVDRARAELVHARKWLFTVGRNPSGPRRWGSGHASRRGSDGAVVGRSSRTFACSEEFVRLECAVSRALRPPAPCPQPWPACVGPRLESDLRGGGDGDRTHYLLHAMQALYQLSYAPNGGRTLPVGTPWSEVCGNYAPARDRARRRHTDAPLQRGAGQRDRARVAGPVGSRARLLDPQPDRPPG